MIDVDNLKGAFKFPLIRAMLTACILSLGGGCAGVQKGKPANPPVHHLTPKTPTNSITTPEGGYLEDYYDYEDGLNRDFIEECLENEECFLAENTTPNPNHISTTL